MLVKYQQEEGRRHEGNSESGSDCVHLCSGDHDVGVTASIAVGLVFSPLVFITEENGMLILSRRIGETIMIGDDVRVTVLGIKGGQVRLGIEAPREIDVHREEIYRRIKLEEAKGSSDGIVRDDVTTVVAA